MFKMLKTYFSRDKLTFSYHKASTACLVMILLNLTSNLSSYNPFLAQNHFACTSNVLQGLQSLFTIILQDLKSFKYPSSLYQLAPLIF
jgi:hypothetical protein